MIRPSGDTIELTPPLIVSENRHRRDHGEGRGIDQSGGVKFWGLDAELRRVPATSMKNANKSH